MRSGVLVKLQKEFGSPVVEIRVGRTLEGKEVRSLKEQVDEAVAVARTALLSDHQMVSISWYYPSQRQEPAK